MAQFERKQHRARRKLEQAAQAYQWLYGVADDVRKAGPSWPSHIYVPTNALTPAIPDALMRIGGPAAIEQMRALGAEGVAHLVTAGLTFATWRMTQGIYRFDATLYPALIDTPASGDIPADVLLRLPEWCVYVETPGVTMPPTPDDPTPALHGAWARIDLGGHGEPLLAITPDTDVGDQIMPPTQHIELGVGSLDDSLAAALESWTRAGGRSEGMGADKIVSALSSWMRPALNLLLYLCADPDYSRRGKEDQPGNPEPVRTRRDGWRLFAADGPQEWDVGVRLGAALRAAYDAMPSAPAESGRQVRAHVRRAHWHTILSGARKREDGSDIPADQRKRDLRWLPPIPVNVDDVEAMPAVVRPVR